MDNLPDLFPHMRPRAPECLIQIFAFLHYAAAETR